MIRKLLVLTLGALVFGCSEDDLSCKTEVPEWCARAILSTEYDPVCGCDGITYTNSAHADCAGILRYKKGGVRA